MDNLKAELTFMFADYRRGAIFTVAFCLFVGAFVGAVVF